ncbi:MAG: IS200/IS605 family transposase [Cyclobacteriaceae bacterium]|nr:IS200/IS605 family transposase [Cyclobacteriaceae bacterium SS2]
MPFIKIWIHAVWATKNRAPLLEKSLRKSVISHIRENAKAKNIYIDSIDGYVDHLHCLISLKGEQSISNIMQLIKGESSFWINQQKWIPGRFAWQTEFFAVSVGESQVKAVRNYINHQEQHHSKKSFQEEYDEFMEKYEFETFRG